MKRTNVLREIRESSVEELSGRLGRLEAQLFQLRLKHATNQIENVSQIRTTRREIARVMTILAERRSGSGATGKSAAAAAQSQKSE